MKQLNKAIREEHKAPKEYIKLEKRLHPTDRKIIRGIIKQERKHYRLLNKIAKAY